MNPLAAAAIVILASISVTFYAFNGGVPLARHFTLYAIVRDAVNVRSPDPVRIAGIDVGTVLGTSPDGTATRIAFSVSSNGLPVHADATVTIRDRLFLEGNYYLDLFPGSPSAPTLREGATIPASRTSSPVQFFKLLSVFDYRTRTNLTDGLETLNDALRPEPGRPRRVGGAADLKDSIAPLAPALQDTAWVARGLQGSQPGDVERLLRDGSAVTSTLAAGVTSLTGLVDGLNTTAATLGATDGSLAQSVRALDTTLTDAPPALTAINSALPPIGKLATALDPSLRLAPPILGGVIDAVKQLAVVVEPAERSRLLRALSATFQQLPSLLSKLGALLPITTAVTGCLRTHVTPILESVVPDGTYTSGRPVWQDFVHFLPGVASAAQNFDANGYWIRLLVGAGTNSFSLGNLPGVGQLVGDTPTNSPIEGARPIWQGDLTSNAFHPEVPCADDALPNLASATAAPDTTPISRGASVDPLTLSALHRLLTSPATTREGRR